MSDDESPGVLKRTYRTVSPAYRGKSEPSMDVVGWGIFLGVVLLLLPLLPLLLVVWLVTKAIDVLAGRGG